MENLFVELFALVWSDLPADLVLLSLVALLSRLHLVEFEVWVPAWLSRTIEDL